MWSPRRWASIVPTGLGRQKPHHFREMARIAWENRDELPFAWRILSRGVCDGCALGTSGLRDWTIPGPHLCMARLELMRLNTAPALDVARLGDVAALRTCSAETLRALGRLPQPMRRRPGQPGFEVVTWDAALDLAADHIRAVDPSRVAFYLTSRGITNEVYYAAQKTARFLGTHHVDNAARLCHAASTSAMKATLGHGASTCSYTDWLAADLIVFFGSNTPNNQPVTTKYLYYAKQRGAEIAVVNTYREPGLAAYWVPSILESAMFGTKLGDHWFDVHTGGDMAFLAGVLRALVEMDAIDDAFVRESTTGFEGARTAALGRAWPALEEASGTRVEDMRRFARLLVDRPNAIFVWSMGLTQHVHGVSTIGALVDVALARGLFGRPGRGLMPIRGHSGVQGGAEVGCAPGVDRATADRWTREWGFAVTEGRGFTATEMVNASARGDLDVFWMVGGNFLDTLPDRDRTSAALARPRLRVHQDIVVTPAMLEDSSGDVLLLPATTRYESPGGGTETSTERRIIFSPEIPGRRVGSARAEWAVFSDLGARVHPHRAAAIRFTSAADIRAEIARAIPLYAGIETLAKQGDQFQWGGPTLFADGRFATPDARAHFTAPTLESVPAPAGAFRVSTRRGKQFNSMVQRDRDPLNGAHRHDILMSAEDAKTLSVTDGAALRLVSAHGTFDGRVRVAPMKSGNLEVHWPEGMALLSGREIDPESHEPNYNAVARAEVIPAEASPSLPARRGPTSR